MSNKYDAILAELRNTLSDDEFIAVADLALNKEALPFYRAMLSHWPQVVGYKLVAEYENKTKEELRTGGSFSSGVLLPAFDRCRDVQLAMVYAFS